jgi:hypothetical protein
MNERDAIFRDQLIALTSDLNSGAGRQRELRRLVGGISDKLAREASVRDWAELKARADGPTYDSLLRLFQRESAAVAKAGDTLTVRVFEILALSLIARRQYAPDLQQGIQILDAYIDECARNARKAGVQVIVTSKAE